jgi:hypothetical protein
MMKKSIALITNSTHQIGAAIYNSIGVFEETVPCVIRETKRIVTDQDIRNSIYIEIFKKLEKEKTQ